MDTPFQPKLPNCRCHIEPNMREPSYMREVELFKGPVDGLRLRLPASNDCFTCSISCIRGGTVLIMDYVYVETGRRTRQGLTIFELTGGDQE